MAPRLPSGGPGRLLLLFLGLDLIPLFGYFAWDLLDGGIGTLNPSTYGGLVWAAIKEEIYFRFLPPGIIGLVLWFVGMRQRGEMCIIAAALVVFTFAWAIAHPLEGQPWSKLVSLVPAGMFYALLWHRTFNELSLRVAPVRLDNVPNALVRYGRALISSIRWGMLAVLGHSTTNVLAEFMWRGATQD